jgi:hypothetical protein
MCTDLDLSATVTSPVMLPSVSTLPPVVDEPSVMRADSASAYHTYMHSNKTATQLSEEHAAFAAAKADLHRQQKAAHDTVGSISLPLFQS